MRLGMRLLGEEGIRMSRNFRCLLMLAVATFVVGLAEPLFACPFCREALAAKDNRIPMAYMYSILFMLAMPPTVLGGIGFAIYRAHKRHAAVAAENLPPVSAAEPTSPVLLAEQS